MKVAGVLPSLVGGVSQQPSKERLPGQHGAQLNMIPDPVRGLCRRQGTQLLHWAQGPLSSDLIEEEALTRRSYEFSYRGEQYVALYRATPAPSDPAAKILYLYNRRSGFVPVTSSNADNVLVGLTAAGAPCIVAVGNLLLLGGASSVGLAPAPGLNWEDHPQAAVAAVWVRGGAFGRTYTVTTTTTLGPITLEVETPKAAYPTPLDTSSVSIYAISGTGTAIYNPVVSPKLNTTTGLYGIKVPHWGFDVSALSLVIGLGAPLTNVWAGELDIAPGTVLAPDTFWYNPNDNRESFGTPQGSKVVYVAANLATQPTLTLQYIARNTIANPNYTSQVAAITERYNESVTKWIADGASAIKPESIAAALAAKATIAGIAATVVGSTIMLNGVTEVVVKDGGDGSLLRATGNTVTDNSQLTLVHRTGKITRVLPTGSDTAYYLKAEPKVAGTSGDVEVVWKETAGQQETIYGGLIYCRVTPTEAFIASTPALLDSLAPGYTTPDWSPRVAGDTESSRTPSFVNRKITYLGLFQDRLIIAAGAAVSLSAAGDYLNFYRKSVLTVTQGDAFELISQSSDDDTIRYSVIYDRNLVLMGDNRQYIIDGTRPVSPLTTSMPVMSSHPNAAGAQPLATGGVIFYGQTSGSSSSIYQIQPGKTQNSSDAFPLNAQAPTYVRGGILEFVGTIKPTHLLVRTTNLTNQLYVYTYLDSMQGGRVQGAWHTFEFAPEAGHLIGMAQDPRGVLLFYVRNGEGVYYSTRQLICDLLPLDTGLSVTPYLDSQHKFNEDLEGSTYPHRLSFAEDVAFPTNVTQGFFGTSRLTVGTLRVEYPSNMANAIVGFPYQANFSPTNPFYRGADGRVITNGSLTVGTITLNMANSSGLIAETISPGYNDIIEYSGRVLGAVGNVVDREVISNEAETLTIAQETRDFTLTLSARKWLPLTITSIEWRGQLFNRTRNI